MLIGLQKADIRTKGPVDNRQVDENRQVPIVLEVGNIADSVAVKTEAAHVGRSVRLSITDKDHSFA